MSPEQNKLVVNLRCVILKKKIKERNLKKKKANLGKVKFLKRIHSLRCRNEMKRTRTKEQRAHCQRFLENMDRLRQRMKLNSIEIVYFAV